MTNLISLVKYYIKSTYLFYDVSMLITYIHENKEKSMCARTTLYVHIPAVP